MYRYQAKLVLKHYIPKKLELGMLFVMEVEGKPQILCLNERWGLDEEIIRIYGYPVEMYIVEEENYDDVIVTPQDIGWFSDGEDLNVMKEFSLKEANHILYEYDGLLEIQIDEESFDYDESVIPVYSEEKVIINYIDEDE